MKGYFTHKEFGGQKGQHSVLALLVSCRPNRMKITLQIDTSLLAHQGEERFSFSLPLLKQTS